MENNGFQIIKRIYSVSALIVCFLKCLNDIHIYMYMIYFSIQNMRLAKDLRGVGQ